MLSLETKIANDAGTVQWLLRGALRQDVLPVFGLLHVQVLLFLSCEPSYYTRAANISHL